MTEKQYKKADSMVFYTLMVVMVGTLLNMLGMLSTKGFDSGIIFVTIMSVVGAAISVVGYKMYRGTKKCGIFMSAVAIIVWASMVIFVDAQFFYMLAGPVFIAQMAYLEKKRIIISGAIIIPIFTVKSLMLAASDVVSATEAGTSIVILIFIAVSVYNIARIWIVFNGDNLDTVRRVSEELVIHFDEANGHIQVLDEALINSNKSMQDITANIENTASEIHVQSQKCADIENSTQNAKAQTDIMVQASGKALEDVEYGVEAMKKLHNNAKAVESGNKQTVEDVEALNERAKKVQNILGTIAGISTQTHLLSMNALVEAARAGEAGKGFAVVADQIKSLAVQTKNATEDITGILEELTEDVERVTVSINRSVKMAHEQNSLIEESKSKFDAIDTGVNQLMNIINDCKGVIDEITEASIVIADGITELSANSEEVAATSVEGTRTMTMVVDDMNQVKATLTQIYSLAQNLSEEYSVQ